jgi:DNA-binding MarR family transcriptional regulator
MVAELVERLNAAGYPDISAAAHPVFENIDPDGTRLTELAARTGMTHQSMGELVSLLERRGYLERRSDPSDGRVRLVALTAQGRRVVRDALNEIAAIEAEWLARWNAAGLRQDLRPALEAAISRGAR